MIPSSWKRRLFWLMAKELIVTAYTKGEILALSVTFHISWIFGKHKESFCLYFQSCRVLVDQCSDQSTATTPGCDQNIVKISNKQQCIHSSTLLILIIMMTSSNGNIFRVTGHLCGEFTGHRWIPLTKASDAELWCLLWSGPEWTVE